MVCSLFKKSFTMAPILVGVCQMCATNNKEKNFDQAKMLIERCKKQGAIIAFLPEGCDYIASTADETVSLADFSYEDDHGPWINKYCELAGKLSIWLSLGGLHRRCNCDPTNKIRNSHVIIDSEGKIKGVYDKCHLFDVDIPQKITLRETDRAIAGKSLLKPVNTPAGNIGALICYDVRFPQVSTMLRQQGAEILTYPSAFTIPTGLAHWEVLMRARAIENQCYVISAAQVGKHNAQRASFGHSLIVDPWGKINACASDKIGIITSEIDLEYLKSIREEMPVIKHFRNDIYN